MTPMARSDRGSATVEFALAMPALVVVLVLALGCVRWALDAAQAQSAAAHAARVAIVEPDATAIAAAAHIARATPGDVTLRRAGSWVTVCVTVPAAPPLPAGARCSIAYDEP
jgi:Flp pilus assembly protein TadG